MLGSTARPLRVGLELTALELDASGTARAIRGLAAALARRDDVEVVPLAHPARRRVTGRLARGLDRELRWWPSGLGRAARRAGVDVVHCPVAPGLARTRGVPLVLTVHDLLALEHPAWFTAANVAQHRLALARTVRRAAVVTAPSTATAAAVEARFGVSARVVPWGVGAPFTPGEPDPERLAGLGLDGPFVVTVATLQPRKNLQAVLAAWPRLRAPHRLVVVGARGWRDADVAARLGDDRVLATGRVDDATLVALLRGADALVHPSRHEGFGFPPLEAMACGAPVVAAAAPSVAEIVDGAGALVDADDPEAFAAALDAVLGDEARRRRMREDGLARAAGFTWERCAERMVAAYRGAVDG